MKLEVQWFLSTLVENNLMTVEKGIEVNDLLGGEPDVLTYAQEILNVLCEDASEEEAQNWASQLEEVIVFAQERAAEGAQPPIFEGQTEEAPAEPAVEEQQAPPPPPPPPPKPLNAFDQLKQAVSNQNQIVSKQKAAPRAPSKPKVSAPSPAAAAPKPAKKAETPVSTETCMFDPETLPPMETLDIMEMPDIRNISLMSDAEVAMTMRELLLFLRAYGASDLHISANAPLFIRRAMNLERLDEEWVIPPEDSKRMNEALLTPEQRHKFHEEQDMSFGLEIGRARFRTSLMYQKEGVSGSYRLVPDQILSLEELGFLPGDAKNIKRLLDYTNGLILVTGPLGSGKTTTLAAMIEIANQNREDHIITVEDPIEIVQTSKKCQITQREIGRCTNSYHSALKGALREDPDIIVIGEMHDLETIENAITASETGHLVIGTLHTCDAGNTLNRILDVFPPSQQAQIRAMTAGSLRGVICQRLIPAANGGLTIAYEVLINTIAVANIISEGRIHQLKATMQIGSKAGMCTLDQNLFEKYKAGLITYETALYYMRDSSVINLTKKFYAMNQAKQYAAEAAARKK